MPEQTDINNRHALLAEYRKTLAHYLRQRAALGSAYAPPGVTHGIDEARAGIRACKAALRGWDVAIEDLPDDEERAVEAPTSVSEQAGAGITAMADLLREPNAQAAVEGFKESFELICRQIDRLSNYKDLHDLLHDLQFNCYNPIIRRARNFPSDSSFVESLGDHQADLQTIVNSLWDVAERAALTTSEQFWIQLVGQAAELVQGAIERSSKELLDHAMFQIGRVLYIHPSRINERLKDAARDLPLPSLIKAMDAVRLSPTRAELAAEKLDQIGRGITALEQLSQILSRIIEEHDIWQDIDLELHRVEENPTEHMQEFDWLWPDLKARVELLCSGRGDRWTQDLRRVEEKLDRALAAHDLSAIVAAFRAYRHQVGMCFFQADKNLKELCRSLRRVDGPLNAVLSIVA
jgi:hypothetical protein